MVSGRTLCPIRADRYQWNQRVISRSIFSGRRGRRFESSLSDHFSQCLSVATIGGDAGCLGLLSGTSEPYVRYVRVGPVSGSKKSIFPMGWSAHSRADIGIDCVSGFDSKDEVSEEMTKLVGLGLYTPAEAGRLLQIAPSKISRWLRGHEANGRKYAPLWESQVDLNDGHAYLGFRDLMEVRIANKFISYGISPQRVRSAIILANEMLGQERPLSTDRFKTDGREIFFRVLEKDQDGEESERLLNLFRRQYEFRQIIEPLLKTVDFDSDGEPTHWWPYGRKANIIVDPARSFGQPIDAASSVPTAALAAAAQREGIPAAARSYFVTQKSVRNALRFETFLEERAAA
jgi:hypothetical protein